MPKNAKNTKNVKKVTKKGAGAGILQDIPKMVAISNNPTFDPVFFGGKNSLIITA